MNIIVLIKQVPDMEKVKFDRDKGVVDRKSAGSEINPFDLNALETAVQISEKMNAKVIAISMGPPSAEKSLKEAIARGANEGILLSDIKFGGADTKATAVTIASGIRKIGDFDLIIAGEKTVDGDTGQVGPEVAQVLNIPHISYVSSIEEVKEEVLIGECDILGSVYLKKVRIPALVTVTKDINIPRLPSFKSKMKAKKAEIKVWGISDLKGYLTEEQVGFRGSPTKVKKIEVPPTVQRQGKTWRGDFSEALDELIRVFEKSKVLEG